MKSPLLPGCLLALLLTAGVLAGESTVTKTTWRDLEAYTLTDGQSVAVVVPALGGRLEEFRRGDGPNWLWSDAPGTEKQAPTLGWGGAKTYLGPQPTWQHMLGHTWPPPLAVDGVAHAAEILPGGGLRTTSPPWPDYDGARIVREFRFAPGGELVIVDRIAPVPGCKLLGCLWQIAQTVPPAQVFVPLNAASPFRDNFFWFPYGRPEVDRRGATVLSPTLLRLEPVTGTIFKLGSHPRQPALATVKDGAALVIQAEPQAGEYPEGVEGAGFPIEVYHHSAARPGEYVELEFLSPIRRMDQGHTLTTRWRIVEVPNAEAASIEPLLMTPTER